MKGQHTYQLTVEWTGNTGNGTGSYMGYERSHKIAIPGKATIEGSSDPAFRGDAGKHNPEEMLVASLSTCHMLWYLHLCADAGIVVVNYTDEAMGIMIESDDGGGQFKEVALNPVVTITDPALAARANALHNKARSLCFIARSVNFKVTHTPVCKTVAS